MTGIYKITNLLNGDCYVGSSKDIGFRWKCHLTVHSKLGRHHEYHIYRAMRKYGVDNFKFEVLEECEREKLIIKEQYYFDLLNPRYNDIKPDKRPLENPIAKKNRVLACQKEWITRSEESKAKAFENMKKGSDSEGSNKFKRVKIQAIELKTGNVTIFNSLYEAEKALLIQRASISQILDKNHKREQAKGYKFVRCD
jgi:group I intron endonuclease